MIHRVLIKSIEKWLFRGKAIVLYGARQVGKTTISKQILSSHNSERYYYNCEIPSVRQLLESKEPAVYEREFRNTEIIVLDEAQVIPDIGSILKIISDHLPELQVLATGSSSFELAQKTSEPLTGRALTFTLYPLSYAELGREFKPSELRVQLNSWLVYGTYPEIIQADDQEAQLLLDDLTSKYLYKDVLHFENLKRPDLLEKLLKLLAFQIGSEVSLHELANSLKVNEKTVSRYIDLLEKSFVIFSVTPFNRNLRKEITKKKKIYFYDVGVRNSIIKQYHSLNLRNDLGVLWENYLMVERRKYIEYKRLNRSVYFWRTHDGQEVDYIEEYNDQLFAYEFKWKQGKKKIPVAFKKAYPDAKFDWISPVNMDLFLMDQ